MIVPNLVYAPRRTGPLYPDLGIDLAADGGLTAGGNPSFAGTGCGFAAYTGSPMRWGPDAADALLADRGLRRITPWDGSGGDYLMARVAANAEAMADTLSPEPETHLAAS